eukprot:TRINITY_DN181_c0_g1::TRINITY_DN181_c0_g1_i1::g.14269::m.14269 TRINITY_DN181_c0_g1::TRINITY_DN181_c0_g1_i1::g.14269  ORF type:complete len:810 (-),score=320.10,sp/Q58A42/DD3_DICDI/29.20/3e-76,SKG6/PF08693.5/0.019 TRINITY_DN181_c0_g1_i1:435-2864(-)
MFNIKKGVLLSCALALLLNGADADIYMHHPRGSNNRLNEKDQNRLNNNRLFDSQNNAKGGYAYGVDPNIYYNPDAGTNNPSLPIPKYGQTFYVDSKMVVEWCNQHSGGANEIADTQVILQMGCMEIAPGLGGDEYPAEPGMLDNMRDGQQTGCDSNNEVCPPLDTMARRTDPKYGQHEHPQYYDACLARQRNKGIYSADQWVRDNVGATATRQNANGARSGTECAEERDYYPYWHPTPWMDIAILTSDTARCDYYKANSQNNVNKGMCVMYSLNGKETECTANGGVYNTVTTKCMATINNPLFCDEAKGMQWLEFGKFKAYYDDNDRVVRPYLADGRKNPDVKYSKDVPEPECLQLDWTRDNHLGNTKTGYPAMVNFTIPNFPGAHCTLRIRYNMTSGDIRLPEKSNATQVEQFFDLDSSANSIKSPWNTAVQGTFELNSPTYQDPFASLFMTEDEVYQKQLQRAALIANYTKNGQTPPESVTALSKEEQSLLSMAVNSNQLSRTFQDRSYMFNIEEMNYFPNELAAGKKVKHPCSGKKVHVLGVRGKRGNIVQTFPAVEHDFVPQSLEVEEGDCINFNWCLTDNDPPRGTNNGEGTESTGRANVVQLDNQAYTTPRQWTEADPDRLFDDFETAWFMAHQNGEDITQVTNCQTVDDATLKYTNCQKTTTPGCLTPSVVRSTGRQESVERDIRNCAKLNAQGPCFDHTVVMNRTGTFKYFSSRENNYSNRQHKGMITVTPKSSSSDNTVAIAVGTTVAVVGVAGASAGAFFYKRKHGHFPGMGGDRFSNGGAFKNLKLPFTSSGAEMSRL